MTKRTPLYERHEAAGARFVPFAGYEMPVQYEGVNAEHARVRSKAGLFDVSHMGEVFVRGPQAAAVVDWLVSNAVSQLAPGEARYGLLCNAEGGVVDDVVAYRLAADTFLVCVNAANRDKDFAWMVENNPHPDTVSITDEGDAWGQIAVQGPEAEAVLAALTGLDLDALGFFQISRATVAGIDDCLVARTGYTGEDGFEVFTPAEGAVAVWDALLATGAPHGVAPIGLGARDTLRLEARLPLYGHELDDTTSPREARLMRFCKFDKPGSFLGADAIEARASSDDRVLIGLVIEGKRIPREGMTVTTTDGEAIGTVTSGTRSPTLGTGIALAYVRKGFGKPGTTLAVDVRGREARGTVHKGPFYRRER